MLEPYVIIHSYLFIDPLLQHLPASRIDDEVCFCKCWGKRRGLIGNISTVSSCPEMRVGNCANDFLFLTRRHISTLGYQDMYFREDECSKVDVIWLASEEMSVSTELQIILYV